MSQQPIFEIIEEKKDKNYSSIVITPLEQGYGYTLGNSLRRVLLSSVRGVCVSSIKIGDSLHEFSSIDGVLEVVLNISLNFKDAVLKMDDLDTLEVSCSINGPKEVKLSLDEWNEKFGKIMDCMKKIGTMYVEELS